MPMDCAVHLKSSKIDYHFMINLFKYIFLKTETEKNTEQISNTLKDMILKNNFKIILSYKNKWSIKQDELI